MDWTRILIIGIPLLAALTTLLLNIRKIITWIRGLESSIYRNITRYRHKVPKETLRLIPRHQHCWWGMGTVNGKPAMQVVCDWYVTNITNDNVMVCGARVKRPRTNGFMFVRHYNRNVYGDYVIPPHFTTEGRADFWIQPPTKKYGQPLVLDLEFLDQYGNVHRVKKVRFRPAESKQKDSSLPLEPVVAITDPTEKEIISVLQNEIHRYIECGRRVGGLGSVVLNYQGRVVPGVGTDWRKSNSPEQQSIISDPQNARIESDNGLVLIKYYHSLNEKQKERFINVFLSRISKDNAYFQIGYFFLYVGYRIGILEQVLRQAKEHLMGDVTYGFSDLIRLLDGFLKYEYLSITGETLDIIEGFLKGIEDHTFRIPERIRAIRTYLLSDKLRISGERL